MTEPDLDEKNADAAPERASAKAKEVPRFEWGFGTGAIAIVLFLVLFHRVSGIFETATAADVAGPRQVSLPLFEGAWSLDWIAMLLGGGLLLLAIVCHREAFAFFRSIKVGVTIVLFAIGACLIGVFVPQLDGMEDPSTRVDLTAQTVVDPAEVFDGLQRWSGERLDLIAPTGERSALRLRAHASGRDSSNFLDLPFEIAPPAVAGDQASYILTLDYGIGRRGGDVTLEVWKRDVETGRFVFASDSLRKLDCYAQKFEGENLPADPGTEEGSRWRFQHQINATRAPLVLQPGLYVLRATLRPSTLLREVDAALPTELVLGRVRVEESRSFRKHYEEFAQAEAELFYYLNNPLRMYGWADPDAGLTKKQKQDAQETRDQVAAEIEVLEANADLYQRDSVRNRKKELELGVATVTKAYHVQRDLVESEDFYRGFFKLVTKLDFNLAYKSSWFFALMALLFCSVLSNTLRFGVRPLFTWRRLGFVTTHLGILITIAGGFLSRIPARDVNGKPVRGILEASTRPDQSEQRGHRGIRQAEDRYFGHYQSPDPGEAQPTLPFKVKLLGFHREDWPGLVIKYPPRTKLQEKEHQVKWIPPAYTLWKGRELAFAYEEDGSPRHRIQVEKLLSRIDNRDKFGFPDPRVISRERASDAASFPRAAARFERVAAAEAEAERSVRSRHLLEPLRADLPREVGLERFVLFGGGVGETTYRAAGREWPAGSEELRREWALRYAVAKDEAELRSLLAPVESGYGRVEVVVRGVGGKDAEQSFPLHGPGKVFDLPGGYRIEVTRLFTDIEEDRQAVSAGAFWQNPLPVAEVYVSSRTSAERDRRMLTPHTDAGALGQQENFHHKNVFVRFDWDAWRTPVDERYLLVRRGESGGHELYRVPRELAAGAPLPEPLQRELASGALLALPSADGTQELRFESSFRSLEQVTRLLPNWLIYPSRPLAEFEAALENPRHGLPEVELCWVDVGFLEDADFAADGVEAIYALSLAELAERWKAKGGAGSVEALLAQRAHRVNVPASEFVALLGGERALAEIVEQRFFEDKLFERAVDYWFTKVYEGRVDRGRLRQRVLQDLSSADHAGARADSADESLQLWGSIRDGVLKPFSDAAAAVGFARDARSLHPYRPGFYDRLPMGVVLQVESAGRSERVQLLSSPGTSQDSLRPVVREEGGDLYLGAEGDLVVYFREQIDKLPYRWKSKIAIVDAKDESLVLHRGEIRVNEYLKYGGWRFFQTNHDPNDPFYSGIGIVFDPGIPMVSLGMALVILGTIYAFLLKPFLVRWLGARS
ncbi:MAG: hypothetical protein IPN34_01100 [Planctomycetes bacterium]|nr:hypothetical protein [Planctomycetota bacterium]